MNSASPIRPSERYFYGLLVLMLIGVRLFHLEGPIDDPHSWRQCDTAQYILDFYQHGIDLFHPSVCWMGGHKTLILEFPLPEAVVAMVYKVLGPDHLYARLVFLLIYLGSAYHLFRIVRFLYAERLAWLTTVMYMSLPLGIFYSRAIHVDFSALLCGLAAVDYLMRGLRENRTRLLLLSTVFATLGFLIKAPYLFYFLFPLSLWIWKEGKGKMALRHSPLLLFPILAFVGWRIHTQAVNAAAPDWFFIPGYLKMAGEGMGSWYFGTWEQRQDGYIWKVLFRERLWGEVLAKVGLLFALLGFAWPKTATGKGTGFARLWLIGVLLYMVLFFNLNYFHNYYQIPFLPVAALLIALGISAIVEQQVFRKLSPYMSLGLLIPLLAWNVWKAETHPHYYHLDKPLIEAGEWIQEQTDQEDLVILSRTRTDPRNPLLLYRARRNGWSMHIDRITPEIVRKLQIEGAAYAGFLTNAPIDSVMQDFLQPFPMDSLALQHGDRTLYLYDLR